MTETTLEQIRRVLWNVQAQKVDKAQSEAEQDGMLGALTLGQTAGERRIAAQLLDRLPEPEDRAVKDYRAAKRLKNTDVEINSPTGVDPECVMRRIAHNKRAEAMEVITERIEREVDSEGRVWFVDPVSKKKRHAGFNNELGDEGVYREQLVYDILEA